MRKPEIRSCIRIQFRASACTLERRSLLRSIYVMRRFRKKGKNRENAKTDQRGKLLLNLRAVVYMLFVPDAPHIREITERQLAGPPHGNLTPLPHVFAAQNDTIFRLFIKKLQFPIWLLCFQLSSFHFSHFVVTSMYDMQRFVPDKISRPT